MSSIKTAILLAFSLLLGACDKKDSFTSASYSDNKTFESRGYQSKEPVMPFGNLKDSKDDESRSIKVYENYVDSKYQTLEGNEEYFLWLASERRKRLAAGKLNGFKQESMPGFNDYYIKKTRATKGNQVHVSERLPRDIEKQLYLTKHKEKAHVELPPDDISDYEILGGERRMPEEEQVKPGEYHVSY